MNNSPQIDLLRYQLRKRETSARVVPYVSFILTHAALVIFLILSFFSNQLLGSSSASLLFKISLAVLAVLLLASEWIYAIVNSRKWKKDILLLQQLEEEQSKLEEQERFRRQEEMIANEQFRNRILQADLQRRQRENGPPNWSQNNPRSVNPVRKSSPPPNAGQPQFPFPPAQMPGPYIFPSPHQNTPQPPSYQPWQ
jgi:hypothetical protein